MQPQLPGCLFLGSTAAAVFFMGLKAQSVWSCVRCSLIWQRAKAVMNHEIKSKCPSCMRLLQSCSKDLGSVFPGRNTNPVYLCLSLPSNFHGVLLPFAWALGFLCWLQAQGKQTIVKTKCSTYQSPSQNMDPTIANSCSCLSCCPSCSNCPPSWRLLGKRNSCWWLTLEAEAAWWRQTATG